MTHDELLLENALEIIFETGKVNKFIIARKLHIGHTRARQLIDTMAELQIIGPQAGNTPRKILMSKKDGVLSLRRYLGKDTSGYGGAQDLFEQTARRRRKQMERAAQILQDMRALIEESKRVPLTNDILIDQPELMRLLNDLETEIDVVMR